MLQRFLLSILFMSCCFYGQSQDTTSVYFTSGSHKLSPFATAVIEKFCKDIDPLTISNVTVIGYADSSGNVNSNLRLSERRAKMVTKECGKWMNSEWISDVQPKGELLKAVDSTSRRVDIIVYYHQSDEENSKDTLVIQPDDPRCFYVDHYLLSICNTQFQIKNRKSVVYIQALNNQALLDKKYYYVKNLGEPNAVAQRVNWKKVKTGKLWWRETRLTATIPADAFTQFGLFVMGEPPCGGCTDQLFKKDTNVHVISIKSDDRFLMSVTQFKTKFLRPKKAKIRVPQEYVDQNETYYLKTYKDNSPYSETRLNWETKKGKKKQDYLYYEFKLGDADRISILKPGLMAICPYRYSPFNDTLGHWGINCRGINGGEPPGKGFKLGISALAYYHNDTLTAALAIHAKYELVRQDIILTLGVNYYPGLYLAGSYRYYFANYTRMKGKMLDPWQMAQDVKFATPIDFYLGAEARTNYNKSYRSFVETNANAGFLVTWRSHLEWYVQGGVGYDLNNRINTTLYPYVQTGFTYTF